MSRISYLNNKFLPHEDCLVHIEDRAFQFGDGVYEVILFENNKLIDFSGHYQRLNRSLKELKINFTISHDDLENIILELFKKNNLQTGSSYIQISRGVTPRIQSFPPQTTSPTFSINVSQKRQFSQSDFNQGISVMTHQDIRWQRCDIKSLNLLAPSMLNQKAKDLGFDDVIMIRDNFITEASFANVFIINNNNQLQTTTADNHILRGITRDRIIKIAKDLKLEVIEQKFSPQQLENSQEIFLTSSTLKVRPVTKVNNKIITNSAGKITIKIAKAYQDFINQD